MSVTDSFPVAAQVVEEFANENITSVFKRKLFLKLFNLFGVTNYCEINRQAIADISVSGKNPFDVDVVSKNFKGIYPELSYSVILEKNSETDLALQGAKLIHAALMYEKNNPVLFAKTVNLVKCGKSWKKEVLQAHESTIVAVVVEGNFYKLRVKIAGEILSLEKIYTALKQIIEKTVVKSSDYGLISACQDENIAKILKNFSPKNINEALFLVAFDKEFKAQSLNDFGRYLHIAGYKNKDYRKSIQFLLDGNCNAGITFNLFSGIEGVAAANFASFVAQNIKNLKIETLKNEENNFAEIDLKRFDEMAQMLDKHALEEKIKNKIYTNDTFFRIDSISKNKIKDAKISPDAFFHVALHLFYFKKMKKLRFVHNFIDLRKGEVGTISRYLTTSPQIAKFLQTRKKEDLLTAFLEHKNRIDKIRSGNYPLHFLYHYLFRPNKSEKPLIGVILLLLFVKNFIKKYLSPDIWASNIPALPGIECLGRFATKLSFTRKNAIAGHYLLFDDHIKICFLASDEDSKVLKNMKNELEEVMLELYKICLK